MAVALLKLHVLAPWAEIGNGQALDVYTTLVMPAGDLALQFNALELGKPPAIVSHPLPTGASVQHLLETASKEAQQYTLQLQYNDARGDRLRWASVRQLRKLATHTDSKLAGEPSPWLRAALAYLNEVDEDTIVVIDWQ
jgi:hypothetical protein